MDKPRVAGPDRTAALTQYRRRASVYDAELALLNPIRRKAIERLELQPGDTILDVGCGTGLSFALLRQGIGAKGRIVGIEQSPDMIARAQTRIKDNHWAKVSLVNSPVETARIRVKADAALFHFTHDILLHPDAVTNLIKHLKPGARVVASGLKWAGALSVPVAGVRAVAGGAGVTTTNAPTNYCFVAINLGNRMPGLGTNQPS